MGKCFFCGKRKLCFQTLGFRLELIITLFFAIFTTGTCVWKLAPYNIVFMFSLLVNRGRSLDTSEAQVAIHAIKKLKYDRLLVLFLLKLLR
jgi:hypothetical protein